MMIFLNATLGFTGMLVVLAYLLSLAEKHLVKYGACKISINSGERALDVEGGRTLLATLIDSKIFIPSACGGRSSCGYCKAQVRSGGGPILPTEMPYLSRLEMRSGMRLACQVKIRQDIDIVIPEDLLNVKLFQATARSVTALTHDIKEIVLSLDDPPEISHRPGQYVQIQAPSPEGPVFRAYSISSPVYEPRNVELVVRLVPGGIASTYLHNLKANDKVAFTGPYGEFRLSEDPAVEIVCVGGGCGMAPMANIIRTVYHRWPDRSCHLFFGCRTARDVFYLEPFKKLAETHPHFHVVYALSDPLPLGEPWDGDTGFIHLSVDKRLKPGIRRQAFLCGPPPMIEAVTEVLKNKGLKEEDIFYDKF